jgi:anaerobic ribonucleoside-triphosphate reductase activating protein
MLPFEGGRSIAVSKLADLIFDAQSRFGIEGITLLGGEPLAHANAAVALAQAIRPRGLTVMIFSGYTIAEAHALPDPFVEELLSLTDILVDGRYERERPNTQRRWIGSTNQRIHFLTDRYRADDPCWKKKNSLEIRFVNGELSVNGFPAATAVGLWKELPRKAR